jgi:HD-GYP domain
MYEQISIERQNNIFAGFADVTLYRNTELNSEAGSHSRRVGQLSKAIGEAMRLPDNDIYKLEIGGLFHDIGKLAIREQVLNKTGPLTSQEWNEIKRHPEIGYRILCTYFEMSDIADYVLYHHERYDGSGYPGGLRAKEIPLLSRIISIADSYDAMTNRRSYKATLDQGLAVRELIVNKGTQFDPDIVDIFIKRVLHYKID